MDVETSANMHLVLSPIHGMVIFRWIGCWPLLYAFCLRFYRLVLLRYRVVDVTQSLIGGAPTRTH